MKKLNTDIKAELKLETKDLEARIASGIIYAFSPSANVIQLQNGNYLITITDKHGTTTAEIPTVTKQNINSVITEYFRTSHLIDDYIQEHNESEQAHAYIRQLIQDAIEQIPTKISDLINDSDFIKSSDVLILNGGNARTNFN